MVFESEIYNAQRRLSNFSFECGDGPHLKRGIVTREGLLVPLSYLKEAPEDQEAVPASTINILRILVDCGIPAGNLKIWEVPISFESSDIDSFYYVPVVETEDPRCFYLFDYTYVAHLTSGETGVFENKNVEPSPAASNRTWGQHPLANVDRVPQIPKLSLGDFLHHFYANTLLVGKLFLEDQGLSFIPLSPPRPSDFDISDWPPVIEDKIIIGIFKSLSDSGGGCFLSYDPDNQVFSKFFVHRHTRGIKDLYVIFSLAFSKLSYNQDKGTFREEAQRAIDIVVPIEELGEFQRKIKRKCIMPSEVLNYISSDHSQYWMDYSDLKVLEDAVDNSSEYVWKAIMYFYTELVDDLSLTAEGVYNYFSGLQD